MSRTVLNPYRTLSTELSDMPRPSMRYVFGSEGPNPGALDLGGGEFSLGTDSDWNADFHGLTVSCTLQNVSMLRALFGTSGVAADDAVLLLSLEWTSPASGWRCLGLPVRMTLDQLPAIDGTINLLLVLPAGSIRGTGMLTAEVFLGSPGSMHAGDAGLARQKGARLGPLSNAARIVIDGDGSLFPVLEESLGPEEALWEMRAAWSDPQEEPFTSEYVSLVLNTDHELFSQLRERQGAQRGQTPLMRHVLASWVALLVHSVSAELEADFDEIVCGPVPFADFATIAEAAALFVRNGGLDTSSPRTLFASAQRWLDRRVRAVSAAETVAETKNEGEQ
ncbi:hypothetical protein O0881_04255 [Janthinobacterium sp. SUN100]|uniref:hypothetical protein n=1 Tax=Janthinobacterium sp. SUN100 TaxID=3004101 RepID=UPI0025B01631|nr:hypothetical protein [Janthinobacterium sp. SUN100]MDN2701209.1 hypothetical protein [Janthinobacterium sp. SUN100]